MRQITIELKESILMKQLAKTAYTIGENMTDDEAKLRHFIQGATDEGHIDLLRDRMDDAWAEILHIVSAYTIRNPRFPCGAQEACTCTNWDKVDSDEEKNSNEDERARYSVTLWFPQNTFPDLGEQLVTLFSRYLVLNGKAEWQAITKQSHSIGRGYGQDYAVSEAAATRVLARIKTAISIRTTNARTKPFNY